MKLTSIAKTGLLALTLSLSLSACNKQPTGGDAAKSESAATDGAKPDAAAKIDINTAPYDELEKLESLTPPPPPGLDHKIIANRCYEKTEDLVTKGILTQEEFDRLKDLITVKDPKECVKEAAGEHEESEEKEAEEKGEKSEY